MADPTDTPDQDDASPPADEGPGFTLVPVPVGSGLFFIPIQWPPPAPAAPVALTTSGTVSDVENAAETYKDVPARALTKDEAMAVLEDLKAQGALTLKKGNILGLDIMPWGVVVGSFKVRKPAPAGQPSPPWKSFDYSTKGMAIDPRLAVMLHRLATYLHVEHDATGMTTVGLARSHERPELSCHNQGRAVDFTGVLFGSDSIHVENHWGAIPFRQDGEVVKSTYNKTTKKFDTGKPVLGIKAIKNFVGGAFTETVRQERLDPEIVVDGPILQSVLGMADPGPPESWSEHTRKTAEELQVKLRKAAKVFLGIFDFFVRESTLNGGSDAFRKTQMTELSRKPISRTNSGNMCIPDGSVWDGHQDHFHAQIGVTGWAEKFDSTSAQAPGDVDAGARKFLYDRTARMILKLLSEAWASSKAARDAARKKFENAQKRLRPPGDALWDDQPEAAAHERRIAIAEGYTDEAVKRRIETFDVPALEEIGPKDPIRFHTRRGRVLTSWYHKVKGAEWRQAAWLETLAADASLSVAQAREKLVSRMDEDLSTWRDEVIAKEGA